MSIPRRPLAIALGCVIALGLLAGLLDATTIRIVPYFSILPPATYMALPGERIWVQESDPWATPVKSSNPAVVGPLGGNWFVASSFGTATLSTVIGPPRGSGMEFPTVLWRATVEVGLPGT